MKKVVVTKGIFPPQPFRHSRDNSRRNKKKKKNISEKRFFSRLCPTQVILMWDKDKIFPDSGRCTSTDSLFKESKNTTASGDPDSGRECRVGSARGK